MIGGQFTGIPNSPNLSPFDGVSFSTFGTGGANNNVRALKSNGTRLYAAGDFTSIGGVPVNRIGYWDGNWHDTQYGTDNIVYALGQLQRRGPRRAAASSNVDFGGGPAPLLSPYWARYTETGLPWFSSSSPRRSPSRWVETSRSPPNSPSGSPGSRTSGTTMTSRFGRAHRQRRHGRRRHHPHADHPGHRVERPRQLPAGGDQLLRRRHHLPCHPELHRRDRGAVAGDLRPPSSRRWAPTRAGTPAGLSFSLGRDADVGVPHDLAGRLVRRLDVGRLPAGAPDPLGRARRHGRKVRRRSTSSGSRSTASPSGPSD